MLRDRGGDIRTVWVGQIVGRFAGTEEGGRAVTELVREERRRAGTELVGQDTVRRGENRGSGSPHFTPFQLLRIVNILTKQVK